jgi:hypothetical protein
METLSITFGASEAIGKLNFENLASFIEIREKSAAIPNWANVEMIELKSFCRYCQVE